MKDSKQAGALRFQNILICIMFVFLWGMVFFQYVFLIPSHKITMMNHGKDFNWLALFGLNLFNMLWDYGIAISILLLGLTYVRLVTNPDTGKKRLVLDTSASIWRKTIFLVLILSAMALVIGAFACTLDSTIAAGR